MGKQQYRGCEIHPELDAIKAPEHDPQPVKAVQYNYSGCVKGITQDRVNAPSHYTSHPSGIECIEITEQYDFCVGNAIKYLWRAGLKSEEGLTDKAKEVEDLKKAAYYINRKIKQLECKK